MRNALASCALSLLVLACGAPALSPTPPSTTTNSATPPAPRTVTVSGAVRSEGRLVTARVRIEGVVTTADHGHYQLVVPASDPIEAAAWIQDTPMDMSCSDTRTVPLPNDAQTLEVDFDLQWAGMPDGL